MPPLTFAQTTPQNYPALAQYDTAVNSAQQEYDRTWKALQALEGQISAIPVDQRDKYSAYPAMVSQQAVLQRDMANSADNLAKAYLSRAQATEKVALAADPGQKAHLDAQTKLDLANAGLVKAQSTAATAKTSIDATNAVAALKSAQATADRTAAEISTLLPAQAANLSASAQEASARATSLVPAQAAAAYAQAAAAQSQVGVNTAQAGQIQAQTTQLLPAQVEQALSSAGLNEAQKDQIRQSMARPSQITQGLDQPNLTFQNPPGSPNGLTTSVPNPNYQAANTRLLQNQADSIHQIQGMLETGQMSPTEAQSYIDAIKAQTDSAMRGSTPFAESQQRQNYARDAGGIGRDILNNQVSQGTSLAQTLLQAIKPVAGSDFNFSTLNPFDLAKGFVRDVGGGQGVADTASSLIQGLQGAGQGSQIITAPDGLPHDQGRNGPISQPLSSYAMPSVPAGVRA